MPIEIQDGGRLGYGDLGITQSGMADRYSGTWANRLLGNPPDTPLLEILLGGVTFVAEVETRIALTGAQAPLTINGISQPLWRSYPLHPGDTITLGMARKGLRIYLSVQGGFKANERSLGSCATTHKEGFGMHIQADTLLSCRPSSQHAKTRTPERFILRMEEALTLRVVPGYQFEDFSPEDRARWFESTYRVSTHTDRMGCRLEGGDPIVYTAGELISEAIAYGAIQIPPDGNPIVLLNERQTIGGYPKIGSIIPMDGYRLAQAQPGTVIQFTTIKMKEAISITRTLKRFEQIDFSRF
jgi:biotin-dependent carboxylase-like uncharacterized protein